MSGGGQPTQSTTTQLSPQQQQIMDLALPKVQDFAASTPQRYPGSTITPFNANETAGQNQVLGAVGDINTVGKNAAQANNFYTSGNIWDPASNPNLQHAVDATVRPLYQNLTNTVLPAIRSDATSTGNFGSSRQGIAEGLATQSTQQAAGDAASKLVQNQYDTNVNAQLKAEALAPSVQQGLTTGGTVQSGVGDVQRAQQQAGLNEQVGNFNWQQYAPFLQAQDLMSLVQGMQGGTTISTGNNPTSNPATSALGGAATGAALGSAIFPGIGTGIGAGAGALLPFLFK